MDLCGRSSSALKNPWIIVRFWPETRVFGIGRGVRLAETRCRSEERRVGEEGRSRGAPYYLKKKKKKHTKIKERVDSRDVCAGPRCVGEGGQSVEHIVATKRQMAV